MKGTHVRAIALAMVGAWMGLSVYAQDADPVRIAKQLKLLSVQKMEVIKYADYWYAVVNVELQNSGGQGIRIQDGTVDVFFDVKEGKIVKTVPDTAEAEDDVPMDKVVDKQGGEVGKIVRVIPQTTAKVLFGTAYIGREQMKSVEEFDLEGTKALRSRRIQIDAASAGKPTTLTRKLYVRIGKADDPAAGKQIAGIATIMGDPKRDFVMKLALHSGYALGEKSVWVDLKQKIEVEMELVPSVTRDCVFK